MLVSAHSQPVTADEIDSIPQGRVATPKEIASLTLFLASEQARSQAHHGGKMASISSTRDSKGRPELWQRLGTGMSRPVHRQYRDDPRPAAAAEYRIAGACPFPEWPRFRPRLGGLLLQREHDPATPQGSQLNPLLAGQGGVAYGTECRQPSVPQSFSS